MTQVGSAKIIYLTAGAAGMYCGSCMHDNAFAKALTQQGWDIQLVPTYTPIRTDEADVSVDQVFFGGINVYLQQKIPWLQYLPAALDRFLDNPKLIRRVTANASETSPQLLGQLSHSMLKGLKGNQRKEVKRLTAWLKSQQPDLIIFSNILIGGCIPHLKSELDCPILVTLQGDDVFLDSLDEPYKSKCTDQIKQLAPHVDAFVVHSEFYREYMGSYLDLDLAKVHVTPLGIDVTDFARFLNAPRDSSSPTRTIGYLAKLAPQKGLHHLVNAFIELKQRPETDDIFLKIAGWLGPENKGYAEQQFTKLNQAGLKESYEYLGVIDRQQKLEMLGSLDVFTVPTEFLEPKALYALEAMAAGIPVVFPDHACFPEMIRESKAGLVFAPGNKVAHADALLKILNEESLRHKHGENGMTFVHNTRNASAMADSMSQRIRKLTG